MIRKWLKEVQREHENPKLVIIDIAENDLKDLTELKKFLANQVLIHLANPIRLKRVYQKSSAKKLTNDIENLKLPPKDAPYNPRQSFWAEIISAEILEKIKGCILPIYKLRYKDSRDKAMRGKADVVVCKFLDEDKPKIIFSEVKSKTIYTPPSEAKRIAKEAYKGLSANNIEIPEIVDYVSERLEELPNDDLNKYDLIDLFDQALLDPNFYNKEFHIFFVFEKNKWREECLEILNIEKIKLPNLTINIVLINSLKELISDTYSLIPKCAEEVVYSE